MGKDQYRESYRESKHPFRNRESNSAVTRMINSCCSCERFMLARKMLDALRLTYDRHGTLRAPAVPSL
jgi:hypothetical protein